MSQHELTTTPETPEAGHGSVRSYTVGFVLSIAFTILAYLSVTGHLLGTYPLISLVLGLGVVQLVVQVLFFLHLGRESKPRWNLIAFLFMLMVVFIFVGGTLWIMYNLNYNMGGQPADQSNTHLIHEENIVE